LNNRYGNLIITTWNKNRVEIEIRITVKGNDLEQVEDKLSQIDVVFSSTASLVKAKTVFEKTKHSWNWFRKGSNTNFTINYFVKMPASNNVDLHNDYGNIYLDKLEGKAFVNCDYGKISIGELLNTTNKINLEYCSSSTISYLKKGDVNIDYSKLTIERADQIRLNADYSNLNFYDVKNLDFNTDYGSIRVDKGRNVSGNSDYSSLKLGTITKNLEINADYGSIRVKNLAKGFEMVDIVAEYTGIRIEVEPGNNFDFVIDLQYASFKRDRENVEIFKSIEKSSRKHYEGVYGKQKSTSKVIIKSQYGGVSIKEKF